MKVRLDYVTNSSSSSFIIARGEELTDEQREIIVEFFEENFLGKPLFKPGMSREEIDKVLEEISYEASEEDYEKLDEILGEGKTIYTGDVYFESVEDLIYLYEKAFRSIDGVDGLDVIDGNMYF